MSDNVRVYEIAEEAGASSTEVIKKAKDLGIDLKSPQSPVSYEDAEEIANYIMTGKSEKLTPKKKPVKITKKVEAKTETAKEEVKAEIKNETIKSEVVNEQKIETKKVEKKNRNF